MDILVNNTSADAIEKFDNEKQNKHQNQSVFTFNPKNYLDTKIPKGQNTKQVRIRILPVSSTDPNIFLKLKTHPLKVSPEIANNGFKSFICLNDPHLQGRNEKGCPLCDRSNELFASAKTFKDKGDMNMSKTIFKQACDFKNKTTYIVRVIVRGKEDEGVKFWRFNDNSKGEGCYDKLMSIYNTRREQKADGTMYNIFDLMEGKDIVLTLSRIYDKKGDTGKTSIQITDANLPSPLSSDIAQANTWINDSKKWTDAYGIKNYDYLTIIADGKIPVRDMANNGAYIGRESKFGKNKTEQEIETAKIAQEILNDKPQETSDGKIASVNVHVDEEEEDLSF